MGNNEAFQQDRSEEATSGGLFLIQLLFRESVPMPDRDFKKKARFFQ